MAHESELESDSESLKERKNEYYKRGGDEKLSWKDSFYQWISGANGAEAQRRVLENSGIFPKSEDGSLKSQVNSVDIGGNQHINEFEVRNVLEPTSSKKPPAIVVLHGYGAGLGLFYKNFRSWASIPGCTLYALDMLGFGLSSRPKFRIQTKDLTLKDPVTGRVLAVEESEDWFIDFLERWRQKKQLDRFVLMAHSLGGYLAMAYAFKHPERVEKLVLISPAGVERGYTPDFEHKSLFGKAKTHHDHQHLHQQKSVSASMNSNSDTRGTTSGAVDSNNNGNCTASTTPENAASISSISEDSLRDSRATGNAANEEMEVTQGEIMRHVTTHHEEGITHQNSTREGEDYLWNEKSTTKRERPSSWVMYLWNTHTSPFKVLRCSAFMAPRLVSIWVNKRFSELPPTHQEALQLYAYRIFSASASGEYALTRILAPMALAREPMVDRVATGLKCPSLWLYGDMDWMNQHAGFEAVKRLQKLGKGAATDAHFSIIERAGHHLYVDNTEDTNRVITEFLNKN